MHGLTISSDSALKDWEQIFQRWDAELQRSVILTGGTDAPYIHTEHGNTHHFGVSASIAGYTTLREVIGERRGSKGGRLDLCIVSENSIDIVEAKHMEIRSTKRIQYGGIKEQLEHALTDARSYENQHELFSSSAKNLRRVGILFITPYFPDVFDGAYVDSVLDFIKEEIKPEILAWSFPLASRNLKYWERLYPGVIALVKCA